MTLDFEPRYVRSPDLEIIELCDIHEIQTN